MGIGALKDYKMTTVISKGDNRKRASCLRAEITEHNDALEMKRKEAMAIARSKPGNALNNYQKEMINMGYVYFGHCGFTYISIELLKKHYSQWYNKFKTENKLPNAKE
jgi:hypothetical protein